MIQPRELVTCLVSGIFLLALGLVPGLLAGVMAGVSNFHRFLQGQPGFGPAGLEGDVPYQSWFAAAGAALIAAGLVLFFY
jgi:hypothetical protein